MNRASSRSSSVTCIANSRVGTRINASTGFWRLSWWSSGSPNAAVLPVPVLDCAMMSLPARAGGISSAWTLVGCSKPSLVMPSKSFGESPMLEKVICVLKYSSIDEHQFAEAPSRSRSASPTPYAGSERRPCAGSRCGRFYKPPGPKALSPSPAILAFDNSAGRAAPYGEAQRPIVGHQPGDVRFA